MATNITGVSLEQPLTDPAIDVDASFNMGGAIIKAGGGGWAESGDMYFEWDQGTATWITIGSTGGLSTADTNPITGLQTVVEQVISVTGNSTGTYNVRIKLIEDDANTHYSVVTTEVTVTGASQHEKSLNDTIGLSDNFAKVSAFNMSPSDTISITDSEMKSYGVNKADTIEVADSEIKNYGMSMSDIIRLADVFAKVSAFTISPSDTIELTDSEAKDYRIVKTDTISLIDSIVKSISKIQDDSISLTDLLVKGFGVTKADSIELVDSIAKEFSITKSDTISLNDIREDDWGGSSGVVKFIIEQLGLDPIQTIY